MQRSMSALFCAIGLIGFCTQIDVPAIRSARAQEASASSVEEIYVLRSLRETRVAATSFCAPLPAPTSEDHYSFHVPTVSAGDGRVLDMKAKPAGHIHGCFGKTKDAATFSFYGAFEINGLKGTARGDCRAGPRDVPEPGLNTFACQFSLSDLAAPYVGGQLTTNSLGSRRVTGEASDPPGYTQVSIATVRLWKKR